MKSIFISTTNTIDNGKVTAYYGIVSSHIVTGAGFLSDFAASVTDILGGRSSSYRRQLESLYDEALDDLSNKANRLGANSILGLRIDMDNISGKGMSMFMITAVGTAAKVVFENEKQEVSSSEGISSSVLMKEIFKRGLLSRLNDENALLRQKDWDTILEFPDNDYVLPLSRMYFQVITHPDKYALEYRESFTNCFKELVMMVDRESVIQGVYEGIKLERGLDPARVLIKEFSLFDAKSLLELIHEGYTKRAIAVINVEKPSYTEADLRDMETLLDVLGDLPDVGKKCVVRDIMFAKDTEKYICQHGHKNNPDVEFCGSCGENIKGLQRGDLEIIEQFKDRVVILKDLLTAQTNNE